MADDCSGKCTFQGQFLFVIECFCVRLFPVTKEDDSFYLDQVDCLDKLYFMNPKQEISGLSH